MAYEALCENGKSKISHKKYNILYFIVQNI